MKKTLLYLTAFFLMLSTKTHAQYSGNFYVSGDLDKYYPVIFQDLSWFNNKATEFEIGRSNVHNDAAWRGSIIGKFRVHATNYGHGSNFIDADIRQFTPYTKPMVAGWVDATGSNGNQVIIIWFLGGTNHYFFNSPVNITPIVYDGVQNALPYQETNGPARSYKTTVDPYVNLNGLSTSGTAYFNNFSGIGNNYFGGNVGIGTYNPDAKLAVQGTIHATEIKVDQSVPTPDYVFDKDYDLASLKDVKTYIDKNHHLPEIPSAGQVAKDGINLGEMNVKLLKKIEELTLYLIKLQNEVDILKHAQTYNKQKHSIR